MTESSSSDLNVRLSRKRNIFFVKGTTIIVFFNIKKSFAVYW